MFDSHQPSLPLELLNEPFTDDDNGLRVEIIVSRPLFRFEISMPLTRVSIGTREVICVSAGRCPAKRTSNVSIQTVYDTYGFAIMLLFLKHLRSLSEVDEKSVYAYIEGSAHALDLIVETDERDFVVDAILDELVRRQELAIGLTRQERELVREVLSLMGRRRDCALDEHDIESHPDLSSRSLPLELVALITNSLRISKAVSTLVRARRVLIIPSIEHVSGRARLTCIHTRTVRSRAMSRQLTRDTAHQVSIAKWTVDCFCLQASIRGCARGSIVSCGYADDRPSRSLYSYHAYYRSQGCDPKVGMKTLLDWLEGEVETMDVNELCAWTVQLISDMAVAIYHKQVTTQELRDELRALIGKAREYDFGIRQL